MGTRNLTCVYIDAKYKVAQYGQWDGYPEGQGVTVLRFLRQMDRQRFENNVRQCIYLTTDELNARWQSFGADERGFISMENAARLKTRWPELSRDTAANILHMIEQEPLGLQNELGFVTNSLFCEWCYVVDLDKNTFEVYKGFNKSPLTEEDRFYTSEQGGEYYPVRLVKSYDLDNLSTEPEFLADFEFEEEEA